MRPSEIDDEFWKSTYDFYRGIRGIVTDDVENSTVLKDIISEWRQLKEAQMKRKRKVSVK